MSTQSCDPLMNLTSHRISAELDKRPRLRRSTRESERTSRETSLLWEIRNSTGSMAQLVALLTLPCSVIGRKTPRSLEEVLDLRLEFSTR